MAPSRPFRVSLCTGCGATAWPAPMLCRQCGSSELSFQEASGGVLEETSDSGGVTLGTVRTNAGPMAIARVVGARPGDELTLRVADRALVGRRRRPARPGS